MAAKKPKTPWGINKKNLYIKFLSWDNAILCWRAPHTRLPIQSIPDHGDYVEVGKDRIQIDRPGRWLTAKCNGNGPTKGRVDMCVHGFHAVKPEWRRSVREWHDHYDKATHIAVVELGGGIEHREERRYIYGIGHAGKTAGKRMRVCFFYAMARDVDAGSRFADAYKSALAYINSL